MAIQTIQDPRSADKTQPSAPSYSPEDLMAETYRALWELGLIPDGSKVDPYAAVDTCTDLLRAFGITPASAA